MRSIGEQVIVGTTADNLGQALADLAVKKAHDLADALQGESLAPQFADDGHFGEVVHRIEAPMPFERGVGKPAREGHRRLYSMNHLTEVAVICELRRKGFSLQGVRKVMRFLDREIGKGLAEIVSRGSDYHLLTDGTHLYLETSARQIVDILKNSDQPILGVCLSDAVRQVRAGVVSGKANTSVTSPDYRRRAKKVS